MNQLPFFVVLVHYFVKHFFHSLFLHEPAIVENSQRSNTIIIICTIVILLRHEKLQFFFQNRPAAIPTSIFGFRFLNIAPYNIMYWIQIKCKLNWRATWAYLEAWGGKSEVRSFDILTYKFDELNISQFESDSSHQFVVSTFIFF